MIGVASIATGYYFNHRFVADYRTGGYPFWGLGSWQQFVRLGYTNPAAASTASLFTSCTFAYTTWPPSSGSAATGQCIRQPTAIAERTRRPLVQRPFLRQG